MWATRPLVGERARPPCRRGCSLDAGQGVPVVAGAAVVVAASSDGAISELDVVNLILADAIVWFAIAQGWP